MPFEHKYKILPREKLIVEYYFGLITYKDVVESKMKEVQDENYSPSYDVVIDLRESELKISEEEMKDLDKLPQKNKAFYGRRRVAYLTNSSKQVVFVTLFKLQSKLPITFGIFSSVDSINRWLGSSVETIELKNVIKELRKTQ